MSGLSGTVYRPKAAPAIEEGKKKNMNDKTVTLLMDLEELQAHWDRLRKIKNKKER